MKVQLQINRVEDCLQWLETAAEGYTASQSIAWLIDQVGMLCNTLAFVNNQMAVAKKELNHAKVRAYSTMIASSYANNYYFTPMLAKDYINAKCDTEQYNYDVCERASRTVTHHLDALRTCISALKEEVKVTNYQMQ